MGRCIVVGLGGASNGGKTSTARKLQCRYRNVNVITQDDYFWPEDDPRHVYDAYTDYPNYDLLTSFDSEQMMTDITTSLTNTSLELLIIEGILIYQLPDVEKKLDLRYFFTLPSEETKLRRSRRDYLPPLPDDYFEKCYWENYVQSVKYVEALNERKQADKIVYLSGLDEHESNFQRICADIDALKLAS